MKSWHIWVSLAAVLFFGFLFVRDYGDAEFMMRQGNYYFGQGTYDLKKAEGFFERAVRIQPDIFFGHYQLARIYFVKGEHERAIEEINKELEANPENLRSLYVRGLIYGTIGKLEQAENDFKKFVAWAPVEWAGHNDLAWILAKERKYEEAEEVLVGALEKVPNAQKNPWLWNSLGVAQLNLKKYFSAKSSFLKAKDAAEALTLQEWQSAYPGNDPVESKNGLADFKKAIEVNIAASSVDN